MTSTPRTTSTIDDNQKIRRRRGGSTYVSNETLWNTDVSLAARTVHSMLLDLAWEATRENRDVYTTQLLKTEAQIAADAGCSLTALRGYIEELRQAGLVKTVRA